MHQTIINLETKYEHLYMELKNDVTSVSLRLKGRETQNDFPLMLIVL